METIQVNRCVHCMADVPADSAFCPSCGKNPLTAEQPAYCLRPFSILRGKYLVGRMLGRGGFGITYVGWDLLLETKVAIKECCPGPLASRNGSVSGQLQWNTDETQWRAACESFLREARKMAKVRDIPEVVRVLDTFEENNTAYIIMDFVEGITLKQWLEQNGTLPPAECVKLLRPMISALDRIHQQGFIHRDISPDNIMLQPNGGLKLLDLGAAKELAQGESNHSQLVTKTGFSPIEQYAESGRIGPWTDVYAMCATLYYCMTGRLVPSAPDRMDGDSLLLFPPETLKGPMPAELEAALRDGLALRIGERIQSMADLLARLDSLEPAPKPKPEPEEETRKKKQKQQALVKKISAAAAAVLLLVVGRSFVVSRIEGSARYVEEKTYINDNGTSGTYTGDWSDGCPNGQGTMIYDNGNVYDGGWVNGLREGEGTMIYADGGKYEGDWKAGQMDGQGHRVNADGSSYEGDFKGGRWEGQGIWTYTDGSSYEGGFIDGKWNGEGTWTLSNGSRCTGEFKDGKLEGYGTWNYSDGSKFEGEFKDGKKNGKGTYLYSNGDTYEGGWKDDKWDGQGTWTTASGSKYVGEYKDGKHHGTGTMIYSGGSKYEGEWENGQYNGRGTLTYSSGSRYVGEWKDGKRNGQGILYKADGSVNKSGTWKNDELISS